MLAVVMIFARADADSFVLRTTPDPARQDLLAAPRLG
jgi:hypothetical protein